MKVRNKSGQEFEVDEAKISEAEADGFYPVVTNGQEEHTVAYKDLQNAYKDGFKLKDVEPEVSGIDRAAAALSGFGKGATMGFADELIGTAKGAGDYLLGKAAYTVEGVPYDQGTFSQNVNKNVAEERARQEAVQKQAPGYATAGQVVGALAGGAKIPTKILPTLTAGAVQGVGESNADLGVETLKDAGIGAAGAGAGFGLGKGVGATAKGVKSLLASKPIETAATVAGEVVGEVPTEIGKKIIKNPALAAEGKGLTALGEDVVNSLNALKTKLSADTDAAWETLKTTNTPFNPSQFQGLAAQVAKSRGIAGSSQSAQKGAAKALMDAEKDLRMAKNWEELKGAIKQIDDNIDWNTPGKDTTNNALRALRTEVDGILKQANPEYAQAMLPVAQKTAQLEELSKALKLDRRGEATDQTISALKTLTRDFSKESKPLLKETIGNVDNQLLQNLEIEGMSQAMGRDVGRGARSAVTGGAAGAAIGAGVGGPIGAAVGGGIGAIAGFTRDKYGRQLAANALKWGSAPIQNMDAILGRIGDSWETLSPTAREAIANASVRGPAAMLSTWAVMKDK